MDNSRQSSRTRSSSLKDRMLEQKEPLTIHHPSSHTDSAPTRYRQPIGVQSFSLMDFSRGQFHFQRTLSPRFSVESRWRIVEHQTINGRLSMDVHDHDRPWPCRCQCQCHCQCQCPQMDRAKTGYSSPWTVKVLPVPSFRKKEDPFSSSIYPFLLYSLFLLYYCISFRPSFVNIHTCWLYHPISSTIILAARLSGNFSIWSWRRTGSNSSILPSRLAIVLVFEHFDWLPRCDRYFGRLLPSLAGP